MREGGYEKYSSRKSDLTLRICVNNELNLLIREADKSQWELIIYTQVRHKEITFFRVIKKTVPHTNANSYISWYKYDLSVYSLYYHYIHGVSIMGHCSLANRLDSVAMIKKNLICLITLKSLQLATQQQTDCTYLCLFTIMSRN